MRSSVHDFLAALAQDCAGRIKEVASEAFAAERIDTAEAQVRNILAGRRRPTVSLLLEAMSDPDRTEALRFLADRAGYDLVRRKVASIDDQLDEAIAQQAAIVETTRDLSAQIAAIADTLRRRPVRVEPGAKDARRRA